MISLEAPSAARIFSHLAGSSPAIKIGQSGTQIYSPCDRIVLDGHTLHIPINLSTESSTEISQSIASDLWFRNFCCLNT
jgi:hypothetical protein